MITVFGIFFIKCLMCEIYLYVETQNTKGLMVSKYFITSHTYFHTMEYFS